MQTMTHKQLVASDRGARWQRTDDGYIFHAACIARHNSSIACGADHGDGCSYPEDVQDPRGRRCGEQDSVMPDGSRIIEQTDDPQAWAETHYAALDGDTLGAGWWAEHQPTPDIIAAAFEAGEISVDELVAFWTAAMERWEELADNPRAIWLGDLHSYGPTNYAPPRRMVLSYVDRNHDPNLCLACLWYAGRGQRLPPPAAMQVERYSGAGKVHTPAQLHTQVRVAVVARDIASATGELPPDILLAQLSMRLGRELRMHQSGDRYDVIEPYCEAVGEPFLHASAPTAEEAVARARELLMPVEPTCLCGAEA